jgi:flagellar biosynthesis protein FlhG
MPMLAIASGKGGVGKTFLAVNLSLALRDLGHRCLLVDLDWGLANIDVALGLAPRRHVGHVLSGECSLEEALIEHSGLAILPNGCGQAELAHLDSSRRRALVESIKTFVSDHELVIADTHRGLGAFTLDVVSQAQLTLVVSTPEPTALTDTYALVKVLAGSELQGPVGLLINQACSAEQAAVVAHHLDVVSQRFLARGLPYWGYLLQDAAVPRSIGQQRALLTSAPRSSAARGVRELAGRLTATVGSRSGESR